MPDQNVIGAIDIGSNAIRMICARLTEDYRIEELEKNRTPLRLGEDVFRMGYITEERIEQLLATIKVYQKTLEQKNSKRNLCLLHQCLQGIRKPADGDRKG